MDLSNIRGALDAQGFYINKKFYPAEICLCCDGILSPRYLTPFPIISVSSRDFNTINYATRYIHGMEFELSNRVNYDKTVKILREWAKKLEPGEKFLIKNNQLQYLLEKFKIPFVTSDEIPPTKELLELLPEDLGGDEIDGRTCQHRLYIGKDVPRCALKKAQALYKWYKKQLKQNIY